MTTLDKQYVKGKYAGVSLEERIKVAALMVADGFPISYRGASAETYRKVEALANKIKQDRLFPQCPCGECD
jgi:hypothetical protein